VRHELPVTGIEAEMVSRKERKAEDAKSAKKGIRRNKLFGLMFLQTHQAEQKETEPRIHLYLTHAGYGTDLILHLDRILRFGYYLLVYIRRDLPAS
jgi:hypothetical protein